jgi:D-serine deaminase-like pyridoxal phosphate-dependent protein
MHSILEGISQPTLLLDCKTAKANLNNMNQKISAAGIRFRPHFKTHQSAQIGEWFRERGISAITVSSVDMAEYFAAAGWQDILIAFSLNVRQMDRIRKLAQEIHLEVLVEDPISVDVLAAAAPAAFDVWIKIDAGAHRTGVDWQQAEHVLNLARSIEQRKNLRFRGLLTHSGNTYHVDSAAAVVSAFRDGVDHLNWLRDQLSGSFGSIEVSVGDTPGCSLCEDLSGIDELRPGNFLFYDAQQLLICSCRPEQIAVAAACPVVAVHPERNEVVLYGGAIHLSKDWVDLKEGQSFGLAALPQENRWGLPIEGAIIRSLSQEHGIVRFNKGIPSAIKPGGLLFILPAHSCLTVQELKKYLTLEGEVIHTMNG